MATILVVDDEPAIRQLVRAVLQVAGYHVVTAANGVEGIALFRSSPDDFDLILTDLQMPVMNGYQLVKLAHETNPAVKIICMSGYAEEALPDDSEFLQKPFPLPVLLARIAASLTRH